MTPRRAAILISGIVLATSVLPAPALDRAPAASRLSSVQPVALPALSVGSGGRALVRAAVRRAQAAPSLAPRLVLGAMTTEPVVALTFDLDMTPDMAAQVRNGKGPAWINQEALAVLRNTGTHATLFMTGMWAELYPGLARSLALDPNFEIANHSYSHPAFHRPCYLLGGLGAGGAAWQLSHSQGVLSRITGVTPVYFRFPGGCYDAPALDAVHAAGLTPVEWTVNAMDAFNPNSAGIAATVLSHVKPGAIVLMHLQGGANAPATGSALRTIIPALRRRGYTLVTVGELLRTGAALQPSGREIVEAYQPLPVPSPVPRAIAPAWSAFAPRPTPPIRACWRWDTRRRIWVRC